MKLIYIVAIFLLPVHCIGQNKPANHKAIIQAEAAKMGNALVNKDYDNFIKTTYPKAIEGTEGGLEKLKEELKNQIATMANEGATIVRVWPGEAGTIIDTAKELQATIPQYMELKLPEGTVKSETTLIAISSNRGKTWYFIDAAGKTLPQMRAMFPNLSTKLVIPPSPEPVFTPNK